MKSLNLWGEMQELSGKPKRGFAQVKHARNYRESKDKKNRSCKQCAHLLYKHYGKKYYKCALLSPESHEATDIRLKMVCDLFKKNDT